MRDPKRIDVFCKQLAELWHLVPDWRFGQLVSNIVSDCYSKTHRDIFFVEDDELMDYIKKYFKGES